MKDARDDRECNVGGDKQSDKDRVAKLTRPDDVDLKAAHQETHAPDEHTGC